MCCPVWAHRKKVRSGTATTFVRSAYRLLWKRQMDHIKQSISWWCFAQGDMTIESMVRIAADIGYEAIELVEQEHWQVIKDHGLDDKTGAEITALGLKRLARFAQDEGVTLILELLNSKVDHPDYQADKTAWGVEVCQMVDSPAVRLLYDIYHMQVMEGDIIRTIREQHAYFGHYHTAGNPGRQELDERQELQYKPIIQAIAATGYKGYLGQEFIPSGNPEVALRQAFDICNIRTS